MGCSDGPLSYGGIAKIASEVFGLCFGAGHDLAKAGIADFPRILSAGIVNVPFDGRRGGTCNYNAVAFRPFSSDHDWKRNA
jgi:hypothetical protein